MPRKKHSEYFAQPEEAKKPRREGIQEELTRTPWWQVREELRIRCPLCGMLPEAWRLDDAPYEVEVQLQRFGGKTPDGRGYMEYIPAGPAETDYLIRALKRKIREVHKALIEEQEELKTLREEMRSREIPFKRERPIDKTIRQKVKEAVKKWQEREEKE
ncbi:MAG: hypothetical protein K6U74_04865 [Firmicutes bacterium]|nr:hypothetical protein [Bacillota bacterium]